MERNRGALGRANATRVRAEPRRTDAMADDEGTHRAGRIHGLVDILCGEMLSRRRRDVSRLELSSFLPRLVADAVEGELTTLDWDEMDALTAEGGKGRERHGKGYGREY